MKTPFDTIATLSEQELLDHFASLVVRDRRITTDLLIAIAEIDERKIWAKHACSSMFTFCMERFHMSEQVTAKRLWAARTARRFPVILEMVERGDLHLGAIHLLAKHLTEENYVRVLERAKHKSSRDVERLVAELAPRADVPSRVRALPGPCARASVPAATLFRVETMSSDAAHGGAALEDGDEAAGTADQRVSADGAVAGHVGDRRSRDSRAATKQIVPLSPRRYKIEITVDEATHDRLRSLQDLLGRSDTGRDPAAIISRAIDLLLERTLARKAGWTDRPRSTKPASDAASSEPGQRCGGVRAKDAAASKAGLRSQTLSCADAAALNRTRQGRGPRAGDAAASQQARTVPQANAAASQRAGRTRTIPAAVRREVWRRDCGRCCYVDSNGRRCRQTSNVEFHHRDPFAFGGRHTSENIELRCAAHNQYQADLDFGRSFMDGRRSKNVMQAAFPGECSTAAAP